MIHYQCPACQAAHASVELMAGMTVICKNCKQPIEVPKESTAAAPVKQDVPKPAVVPPILVEPIPAPPSVPALAISLEAPLPARIPRPVLPEVPPPKRSRIVLFVLIGVFLAIVASYIAWIVLRPPRTLVVLEHEGPVWCVAASSDGRHIVSGGAAGALILWDGASGSEIRRFEGHSETVTCVAFDRDGNYLLSGSFDRTVRLWEVKTGQQLQAYSGHQWFVTSVAFSADGQLVASASADQTVRLWDVVQSKEQVRIQPGKVRPGDKNSELAVQSLGRLPLDGDVFTCVGFTPDDRSLFTANVNRSAVLWNATTGDKQRDLGRSPAPLLSAALSRDGRFLLAGGGPYDAAKPGDFDLHLWDALTGLKVRSFAGHTEAVTSVAFSPDGRRALSGSRDRTVRLWDVETGQELHRFEGHRDIVTSVAFSASGGQAISGSFDKAVRLWRLPKL